MTILVTGASGNVGKAVLATLQLRALPVRIAMSQPARPPPGVEAVRLSFTRPETFAAALEGARAVFLLRPRALSNMPKTLNLFIDEASKRGVEHIVFLSVAGADKNSFVPHAKVEAHLRASNVAWTFLRPGFFAQNLGDAYRQDIVTNDRIYVPAGQGQAAFVDVRDVAAVAALAFTDPRHRGQAYTLTGAEELSFAAAALLLTAALGRPIRYQAASIPGYAVHLLRRGLPAGQIAVQCILHALLRRPGNAPVDPTLAALLGRTPTTLAQYITDHVALWQRP